jgi:hypothetical protein
MLMAEVASMSAFPNVQMIKDIEDRELRLREASQAAARLRELTNREGPIIEQADIEPESVGYALEAS